MGERKANLGFIYEKSTPKTRKTRKTKSANAKTRANLPKRRRKRTTKKSRGPQNQTLISKPLTHSSMRHQCISQRPQTMTNWPKTCSTIPMSTTQTATKRYNLTHAHHYLTYASLPMQSEDDPHLKENKES